MGFSAQVRIDGAELSANAFVLDLIASVNAAMLASLRGTEGMREVTITLTENSAAPHTH